MLRLWPAIAAITLGVQAVPADASQAGIQQSWSVEAPHGPTIDFKTTLDEATWMSVDISPDGRMLVFDILGDLYTMPVTGGDATRITQGAAYDAQPRFSPDGRTIAFISDRGGSNDLWLADANGDHPRLLAHRKDATMLSPAWTPDGKQVVAGQHDDLQADDGYDLYGFPLDGGAAVKLVDKKRTALGPVLSPDGRWVYFSSQPGASGAGIDRVERATGTIEPIVRGNGGAVRPAISADGRWLAFGRRVDSEERLFLRDLASGAEHALDVRLNWDQQDNSNSDVDDLPGYSFTPDSSAIIYTAQGKIWRYDLARRTATNIPFRARFEQRIQQKLTVKKRIEDGPVALKLLRWTHQSPDGRTIFFSAAGKIYRYDVRGKTSRRIGTGGDLEYSPAVSPDGRWLAYVIWSDRDAGHIVMTPVDRYAPVRLTAQAGHYEHLAWSADSKRLVFLKSSGGELRGEGNLVESLVKSIRWIEARRDSETHFVTSVASRGDRRQEMRPSFNARGDRIYFTETPVKRRPTILSSIALDGSGRKQHASFRFADDVIPSPDEKWLAFTEQFEVYLVPFSPTAALVDVDPKGGRQPVTRLSRAGGYFVNWADQGRAVTWGWGPDFFRQTVGDGADAATAPAMTHINLTLPRAAAGQILLRGARIVTMGPAGVIESGDMLIEGNRIKAVGPSGSIARAGLARVIDVAGKTIIPGLIDTHNHYRQGRNVEIFPRNDWGYVVQLAYGVTTVRDPSARSQSIFTQAEMIETGTSIGPRVFSTGEPVYFEETAFSRPLQSLDDARAQVGRLKRLGAAAVKLYIQPRREQRQWLLQAAREAGMIAIPEGAQKIFFDLTLLMDGYSTLEHAIKTVPLYKDVRSLIVATGTPIIPTLTVGPGGSAEDYFYQQSAVSQDEKLLRFTPYSEIAGKDRLKQVRPADGYFFTGLSQSTAQIFHEGGRVALGAHGNLEGLGVHWEMWAMAMGGLSPLETLRTATVEAAGALGLDADLGSLESGKIADLVVLDANPVEDIRNSNSVRYVMKSGMLWDGGTMDQIWPLKQSFPGFYWRGER